MRVLVYLEKFPLIKLFKSVYVTYNLHSLILFLQIGWIFPLKTSSPRQLVETRLVHGVTWWSVLLLGWRPQTPGMCSIRGSQCGHINNALQRKYICDIVKQVTSKYEEKKIKLWTNRQYRKLPDVHSYEFVIFIKRKIFIFLVSKIFTYVPFILKVVDTLNQRKKLQKHRKC